MVIIDLGASVNSYQMFNPMDGWLNQNGFGSHRELKEVCEFNRTIIYGQLPLTRGERERLTMNKTLKLALSVVVGAALVAPATAQNFPDIPENHWAYQAVMNLKDKVVFGYPDGFFRGNRTLTRYEFAVVIDKLWQQLSGRFDGMNDQIAALEKMIEENSGGDNPELAQQLAALRNEVNGMKGWGTAISDLQKLTGEFERELAALNVDVDGMKRDIQDLDERLSEIENSKNAVELHANVDLLVLAAHSQDNTFGLLPDGTILGNGRGSYNTAPVGMVRDLSVLHNADLKLSGGDEDGVAWNAVLNVGNVFNSLGNLSSYTGGASFSEGNTDVYFQEFNVTFNSSLAGQGLKAEVGRVGHKVGKYMWSRTSFTEDYYHNYYRDNGEWYFDGGIVNFDFGAVDLTVFGGRNSMRNTVNGNDINPSTLAQGIGGAVDQTLGVQLDVPIGDMGEVTLAYLWQDSDTVTNLGFGAFNRRNVYGADVKLMFDNIHVYGSYAESTLSYNTSNVLTNQNAAWDAKIGYHGNNFAVMGGYRHVEGQFMADGDWGRVGTWWNPRNVEGWNAKVVFNPSEDLKIWAKGEVLEGVANGFGGFLSTADKATTYAVGVNYDVSETVGLGVKYEDVKFNYNVGTDPTQRWLTFMFGYNVDENAKLMFTYTYSDVDFRGRAIQGNAGASRYKGGLLGTQLSVKF